MEDKLFNELVASIEEAGAILRGEVAPSRSFHLDNMDVKKIRQKFDVNQKEFARMLNISVKTLQNWEQGRREPTGPAKILLLIADQHPDAVLQTVGSLCIE